MVVFLWFIFFCLFFHFLLLFLNKKCRIGSPPSFLFFISSLKSPSFKFHASLPLHCSFVTFFSTKAAASLPRDGCVSCSLFQCLDGRVLADLGGAQWVSSVDCGGWRSTDIGLMGKLSLVLTWVDGR